MKRGKAARVTRHDVGALAQQEFGDFGLVVERCSDEEGCLVACPAVDVGTACQGLLHGTLVAGGDGVEQLLTCGCSCSRQYQHTKCQQSAHDVVVAYISLESYKLRSTYPGRCWRTARPGWLETQCAPRSALPSGNQAGSRHIRTRPAPRNSVSSSGSQANFGPSS